jgi:signal transduction histidine kinase
LSRCISDHSRAGFPPTGAIPVVKVWLRDRGLTGLRLGKANLVIVTAAAFALAVLTVFAIELSNTQVKSRADVEAQVHDRAVRAGALIDSLLHSVPQSMDQEGDIYGSARVADRTLDAAEGQQGGYLALLASNGQVLANSSGFGPRDRAEVTGSGALSSVRSGRPYALSNLSPYGRTGVIDFDVAVPTHYGRRILIAGFEPKVVSDVVTAEFEQIPGVKGARNYLVDGNDVVLASTNPGSPVGKVIDQAGAARALERPSADVDGYYFDEVVLTNSNWRMVLVAPNGPLFASVGGLHEWLPWLIFVAFALVAGVAFVLGLRLLLSIDRVRAANERLQTLNSELADANSALERRAAELARSNEELDQFASIASHDLQEPLRKVRTFAGQLATTEGGNLSVKGHDYLDRLSSSAERMQKLIEDLLRFSRVATQGHPFLPVDLREITNGVLVDLDAQIEGANATVHVGELPVVRADALQLRQLMQNLVSNALKFCRPGVPVEISIDAALVGEMVVLRVRDNGIGFDPKYSERIFRIFERLHGRNDYPGTGIGLAMCRKIAERHGGTIEAYSRPGQGSTFTVRLPMYGPQTVTLPKDEQDGDSVAHEKAHAHA